MEKLKEILETNIDLNEIETDDLLKVAVEAIEDKLGVDTVVLNVGEVSSLCDYFIITSGSSQRQVKSIAESVEDSFTQLGLEPRGKEGYTSQNWVLLDYGDIMVHIFDDENRGFYNLEKLWKDAPYVEM